MNIRTIAFCLLGVSMTNGTGGCATGKGQNPQHEHHHNHKNHEHQEHQGEHHRFENPEEWVEKFEGPERDAWQEPDKIIAQMNLTPGAIVAEIGSGTGYFASRIARAVPQGKSWAIDVEPKMVRYVNKRAQTEQLTNLFSTLGTYTDPLIPEPVDWILLANTYHHIENRPAYLKGLIDYLKPNGRILIVEFKKGDLPHGPPDEMKLAPTEVVAEFKAAGFELERGGEELEYHYTQIFKIDPQLLPQK